MKQTPFQQKNASICQRRTQLQLLILYHTKQFSHGILSPSLGQNWDQASDNRGMIHWQKLNIHIFGPGFAIRSHSLLVNLELFVFPVTRDRDTAGSCCFQFQKLFKESFRCHFILGIHHCLLIIPYWGYDLLDFCCFEWFFSLCKVAHWF